jgi:hypothetical protein
MIWKIAATIALGAMVLVGAISLWASFVDYPLPLSWLVGLFIVSVAIFLGSFLLLQSDE